MIATLYHADYDPLAIALLAVLAALLLAEWRGTRRARREFQKWRRER